MKIPRLLSVLSVVTVSAPSALAAPSPFVPPAGIRENTPRIQAFVHARIVVAPGRVIAQGTLVARDGVITAVGARVRPPKDATVVDMVQLRLLDVDRVARRIRSRGGEVDELGHVDREKSREDSAQNLRDLTDGVLRQVGQLRAR